LAVSDITALIIKALQCSASSRILTNLPENWQQYQIFSSKKRALRLGLKLARKFSHGDPRRPNQTAQRPFGNFFMVRNGERGDSPSLTMIM